MMSCLNSPITSNGEIFLKQSRIPFSPYGVVPIFCTPFQHAWWLSYRLFCQLLINNERDNGITLTIRRGHNLVRVNKVILVVL